MANAYTEGMGTLTAVARNTRVTLEMIKWEHSVFALPFALTGAVLAAAGVPPLRVLVLILLCMVSARTAAMSFNRLIDAEIDRMNPRTSMRAIPAGLLSRGFVASFTVVSSLVFLLAAGLLNRLTFWLSPIALAIVLLYSYMKRITRWSHLVLGLALGIAPSAAWIAVRGNLDWRIVVLTVAVLLWVAGFDVLYACQDFDHDRANGLNSIPQAFGVRGAFWIARAMHVAALLALFWLVHLFHLHAIALGGVGLVGILLAYEHSIISPTDIRRMNAAFFTLNGIISAVYFFATAADVLVFRAR